MIKVHLFLALFGFAIAQNVTLPFNFFGGGSYLATGKAVVYSPTFGAPIINNSSIAIDVQGQRILWKTGAGGNTLFTADGTYARLDSLYPGTLFRVADRQGNNITVLHEVEGYTRATQAFETTTYDTITITLPNGRKKKLKKSDDIVYTGIVDDAQRCGFPASVSLFVNQEYNVLTHISFDQLFVAEIGPPVYPYIPVVTYLRITFDNIKLGVPPQNEFDLGYDLSGPSQDWCSKVTGGYLPLLPQLGGY